MGIVYEAAPRKTAHQVDMAQLQSQPFLHRQPCPGRHSSAQDTTTLGACGQRRPFRPRVLPPRQAWGQHLPARHPDRRRGQRLGLGLARSGVGR